MTKYINNIKTIADFNYIDLELLNDKNIKFNDALKIEGIIKSAYTFDGNVTEALIKCATRNILGCNVEINVMEIKPIQEYYSVPIQNFHVTDKNFNILFIVHVSKGVNQFGQNVNEFGIAI